MKKSPIILGLAGILMLMLSPLVISGESAEATNNEQKISGVELKELGHPWDLVPWTGDKTPVSEALEGISQQVNVVWGWDGETQTWMGYFPQESFPGVNDLKVLRHNQPYWISTTQEGVVWEMPVAGSEPEPTNTPEPTSTPEPANTPVNTPTSVPTATPTPEPTTVSPPPAPEAVHAEFGENEVSISWSAVSAATSYELWGRIECSHDYDNPGPFLLETFSGDTTSTTRPWPPEDRRGCSAGRILYGVASVNQSGSSDVTWQESD